MNHWGNVLKEKLDTRTARVCIVGMGYVGLSLAVEESAWPQFNVARDG